MAKKPIKTWDVDVNGIVVSELVEAKPNSYYMIEDLDKVIKPLVLVLPKASEYIKTFKAKDGYKDKSNKLMSFDLDEEKLLEKYKTIWTKIENLKKKLN